MSYNIPPDHHGSLPKAGRDITSSVNTRSQIVDTIVAGQQALQKAHRLATQANPMCANVAAFQRLEAIGKELISLQQEIAKMRGL